MSDKDPFKPIVIDVVKEVKGNSGKDLKHCFFLPAELKGFYNFFDEHGRTLATGVKSNESFPFLLHGHAWTINMINITDEFANGSWSNSAPTPLVPPYPNPGSGQEQEGSFQASSGGGADTDAITESVTANPPLGAIVIDKVTGNSDKDKLKGCYFTVSGTTYNLYNKNGKLLQSGISNGTNFSFNHDKAPGGSNDIAWTVTNFFISQAAASGNWSNPDSPLGVQEGSFQASSGGGMGEGEAAAGASA
jgi:hypothetical protein